MWEDFKEFILPFIVIITLGLFIVIAIISIPFYIGSCKQAKIFNQQNNTNYTCSDFFWASEQINQQTQTIKIK